MNIKPEITIQDFANTLNAARNGDTKAMCMIAYIYFHGLATRTNHKLAVIWWTVAANSGETEAQYWLGYCYEFGLGVVEDRKVALAWLRKSADSGNESAQMHIVFLYLLSRSPISDLITREEAIKFCRMAAAQGNTLARQLPLFNKVPPNI